MLTAITREVSESIHDCELSFHARTPIDLRKAIAQHAAYQDCLAELGARIISLPAEPNLPDSVFVEDAAVVTDEVAIIPIMGAPSRRPEVRTVADALSRFRPLKFLREPATLDGGDVLRVGRRVFVGLSQRTNQEAVDQLHEILRPFDYRTESIEVTSYLHLKSACSYVGNDAVLISRMGVDAERFRGFQLINICDEEPGGANALLINDVVIMPASFPRTRELLQKRGFRVRAVDVSELEKAEAGVTCGCLILDVKN